MSRLKGLLNSSSFWSWFHLKVIEIDGINHVLTIQSLPKTQDFTTLPATLQPPMVESKSQTSLALTWRPHGKIADGHRFQSYQVKIEAKDFSTVKETSNTRIVITGLTPDVMYSAYVRVVTDNQASLYSDALKVTTEPLKENELEQLKQSLGLAAMQVRSTWQ